MKLALTTVAALLGLVLTTAAQAQGQCFRPHDVQNFTVSDDEHSLWIRSGNNKVFRLDIAGQCPNLSFRESIQLDAVGGAGSVCSPIEVDLRVRSTGVTIPCTVTRMHELTADELAALPKKLKP